MDSSLTRILVVDDEPIVLSALKEQLEADGFQVVTVGTAARTMTVRECLWNADPDRPTSALSWGASTTVALYPRPKPQLH